jgi:hypothetical protein
MEKSFAVTTGRPHKYVHTSESSGKAMNVFFCSTCGTKLYLTLERFRGTVGVYGGTLDDPNCFGSRITRQIFLRFGRKSTVVLPDVESYWEHAVGPDDSSLTSFKLTQPIELGTLLASREEMSKESE